MPRPNWKNVEPVFDRRALYGATPHLELIAALQPIKLLISMSGIGAVLFVGNDVSANRVLGDFRIVKILCGSLRKLPLFNETKVRLSQLNKVRLQKQLLSHC